MESTCGNKAGVKTVALDSNMLVSSVKFKIDVFEELRKMLGKVEFVIPSQVAGELKKIAEENKKNAKVVEVAKMLMKKNCVETKEVDAEDADSALLKMADSAYIASNDRELRKRIKRVGGKIVYLRKKKILEIDGGADVYVV